MYEAGMRFKAVTLGFVLAGTALGSAALNLGRARGAAWIGQSLELVVPVQVDSAQSDGTLCAEADVFHGDNRQDNGRIQVQVEPTGQTDTFNLRILSTALIDEPVVTVYLRAGCTQKSSRKFVLLADLPNDGVVVQSRQIASPVVPTVAPVDASNNAIPQQNATSTGFPEVPIKSAMPSVASAPKPAAPVVETPAPKEPAPEKKVEKKLSKAEKPAAVPDHSTSSMSTGKSRLQLDPLDTLSWRIKSLESNGSDKSRLEEVARDNQKMQKLQTDLRGLLDQAVKNEASLAAMRERLEKAESDRVPLTIVYALIALLLVCVATLIYFLSRRPRYVFQDASIKAAEPPRPSTDTATLVAPQTASEADVPHSQAEAIDVNLLDLDEASFGEMMGGKPGIVPRTTSRHHNFNADTLIDLRQQAEFLAKLGKVDEALQVLERGIQSNPVESPLLYLDLLVIANNFSRKTDFRHFRAEFVELFNAEVPEFALFRDEGRKLEAYPALLDHIKGQWESPNVLDVIEACILRDAEVTESDPFDLAAFRELLEMHAAAIELHHINTTVP
jgi:hypothetical protein